MIALTNLIKVLKSKIWLVWIIIGVLFISIPSYYFMQRELVIWNLWITFYNLELGLIILIALLFWIFLWATLYKMKYFWVNNSKSKRSRLWFIWWLFGVLVAGCPACSITLASYIWLASIISLLPYKWLELKVVSVFLLIYAIYITLKNLEVCSLKNIKTK